MKAKKLSIGDLKKNALAQDEMKKIVGGNIDSPGWCGINYCYPDKFSCWRNEGYENCYQIIVM
jgi:natural product precursor